MSTKTKTEKVKEGTVQVKKEKEEPEVIHAESKKSKESKVKNSKKSDKSTVKVEPKAESKAESKAEPKVEQKVEEQIEQHNEVMDTVQNVSHVVTDELKFTSQLASAQEEISKVREQLKLLTVNLKKLESAYSSDMKKAQKTSKKVSRTKKTGFAKPKLVPDKLAKFIGVNLGTELSGPEVTKKVWAQLREKGLMYEKDKRVFRTNAEVSDVFNVPKSVNKSVNHEDSEGFNFRNLQKYIANAYKQ